MDNMPTTIPATLDSIALQKAEILKLIRLQKEIMTDITHEIFAPVAPAANKTGSMMRAFNTGMAVFDGLMLGIKVMKKFRRLFGRRR